MEFDFGGYATKNDVLCTDGRIIRKGAFKAQNGQKVPLVWMHQRNEPTNVLGHAYLEDRDDGVYCYCKFNESSNGQHAKLLVEHGDINSLSIFANDLVQKGANVTHGAIREVSLVIAPANSGALIDNPVVQHGDVDSDNYEEYEDTTQATISWFSKLEHGVEFDVEETIEHAEDKNVKMKAKKKEESKEDEEDDDPDPDEEDKEDEEEDDDSEDDSEDEEEKNVKEQKKSLQHADEKEDDEETVQDVYDTLTDKQKKVVAFIVGSALAAKDDDAEHSDMEGEEIMPRNVFDQNNTLEMADQTPSLSHDQISAIFEDAQKCGSFRESCLAHAQEYGIENIELLFPDAKAVANQPYMIQRDMEWVAGVLSETKHIPFAKFKSLAADITADEARAKGYVKGNLKKEEVVKLLKRETSPTTIYKKQKLDRDDILDITDFNVVAWLMAEMRVMLNEEIAGAILVSDGREIDDEDKIDEEHIRPIWKDNDLYAHHITLPADLDPVDLPEEILKAQQEYKGSGSPSMYTTGSLQLSMLLLKDKIGRRLYNTQAELSAALDVSKIVKVPVMENRTRVNDDGKTVKLLALIVNLRDYYVGTNAGGQITDFEDFDIDYNQYKYLKETRMSGALVMPKSAIVIEQEVSAGSTPVTPPSGGSDMG